MYARALSNEDRGRVKGRYLPYADGKTRSARWKERAKVHPKLGPASEERRTEGAGCLQKSVMQASCEKRHSDGKNEEERTQASGEMKQLDRIRYSVS